jgi:hypothetical protein
MVGNVGHAGDLVPAAVDSSLDRGYPESLHVTQGELGGRLNPNLLIEALGSGGMQTGR